MLNPVEEKEIGESVYQFKGGDDEIVEQVNHEMAMKQGEIVEVESDEEAGDDTDSGAEMGLGEMICLCEQMEKFRIELRRQEQATLQQTMLGRWFSSNKE
ncbi:hypothetical protein EDC04DRAFT_2751449 [Pisolithus marmoratus]|nr:hypothetical protein EDC04DRAFT_2751449 [Pisolithus marmoratus]